MAGTSDIVEGPKTMLYWLATIGKRGVGKAIRTLSAKRSSCRTSPART